MCKTTKTKILCYESGKEKDLYQDLYEGLVECQKENIGHPEGPQKHLIWCPTCQGWHKTSAFLKPGYPVRFDWDSDTKYVIVVPENFDKEQDLREKVELAEKYVTRFKARLHAISVIGYDTEKCHLVHLFTVLKSQEYKELPIESQSIIWSGIILRLEEAFIDRLRIFDRKLRDLKKLPKGNQKGIKITQISQDKFDYGFIFRMFPELNKEFEDTLRSCKD